MKILCILVVLCVVEYLPAWAQDHVDAEPEDVTYCRLTENPAAFIGKRIRIRAIYNYGFEVSILRSPTCCPERGPNVGIVFDSGMDDRSDKPVKKLDTGMGVALATFVGRVDRVKNASSRLPSGDRLELTVERIETVEKSVPYRPGVIPKWVPSGCSETTTKRK